MIAHTATRVNEHTSARIRRWIEQDTRERLLEYAGQSRTAISLRIRELETEWDIDRCLEAGSAGLVLAGLAAGIPLGRKWLALSAAASLIGLQHALHGWSPALPLLRQIGVRTAEEINRERYALKALRGDFEEINRTGYDEERAETAANATAY